MLDCLCWIGNRHREFGEEAGLRIDDVEDEEKEKKYED